MSNEILTVLKELSIIGNDLIETTLGNKVSELMRVKNSLEIMLHNPVTFGGFFLELNITQMNNSGVINWNKFIEIYSSSRLYLKQTVFQQTFFFTLFNEYNHAIQKNLVITKDSYIQLYKYIGQNRKQLDINDFLLTLKTYYMKDLYNHSEILSLKLLKEIYDTPISKEGHSIGTFLKDPPFNIPTDASPSPTSLRFATSNRQTSYSRGIYNLAPPRNSNDDNVGSSTDSDAGPRRTVREIFGVVEYASRLYLQKYNIRLFSLKTNSKIKLDNIKKMKNVILNKKIFIIEDSSNLLVLSENLAYDRFYLNNKSCKMKQLNKSFLKYYKIKWQVLMKRKSQKLKIN